MQMSSNNLSQWFLNLLSKQVNAGNWLALTDDSWTTHWGCWSSFFKIRI